MDLFDTIADIYQEIGESFSNLCYLTAMTAILLSNIWYLLFVLCILFGLIGPDAVPDSWLQSIFFLGESK